MLQSLGVDPDTPVDGVAGLWDEVLGSLAETLQVVVMAPHVRARGLCIPPGSASEALASLAVQCDGVWVGVQGMLCASHDGRLRAGYHGPVGENGELSGSWALRGGQNRGRPRERPQPSEGRHGRVRFRG